MDTREAVFANPHIGGSEPSLKNSKMPQSSKRNTYKRKGNKRSCDNHRRISLLAIAGKNLARVLLNSLLKHLEQGHLGLPESHVDSEQVEDH